MKLAKKHLGRSCEGIRTLHGGSLRTNDSVTGRLSGGKVFQIQPLP
jgi:hypothetical protein